MSLEILEENNEEEIIEKIKSLKKKILEFLTAKLNVDLTDKNINIELIDKNIGKYELILYNGIKLTNIEEFNVKNNNSSDLDLTFNNINYEVDKAPLNNISEILYKDIQNSINDIKNLIYNNSSDKELMISKIILYR